MNPKREKVPSPSSQREKHLQPKRESTTRKQARHHAAEEAWEYPTVKCLTMWFWEGQITANFLCHLVGNLGMAGHSLNVTGFRI